MSARRLAALLPRGCYELAGAGQARCLSALSQAAGTHLVDATAQPSTSYALAPWGLAALLAERSEGPVVHAWRRLAHKAECRHDHDHHTHEQPHHDHGQSKPKKQAAAPRRSLTLEEMEKACRSCDKLVKRGGLVCNGCETIQPPDESLNYFDLFSLPNQTFDVSTQLLERRYKSLQWNLHPDKMGHKPAQEQEFSAKHASTINLAYSVLKHPLSRANYMLALRGINAGDSFQGTIDDPELLMEVLEAREEVEGTDDPAVLSALLAHNHTQQEALVARLSAAFRSDDMAGAVSLTHQLQYVAKLEQEIVKKLPLS